MRDDDAIIHPDYVDSRRQLFIDAFLLSFAACFGGLSGCGGGSGQGGPGGSGASGGVSASSGAQARLTGSVSIGQPVIQVVSAYSVSAVGRGGTFLLTVSASSVHAVIAVDGSGIPLAIGMSKPGDTTLTISADSTAIALAVIATGRAISTPADYLAFVQSLQGLSSFTSFKSLLESDMQTQRLDAIVARSDFQSAFQALAANIAASRAAKKRPEASKRIASSVKTRLVSKSPALKTRDAGDQADRFDAEIEDASNPSKVSVTLTNNARRTLKVYRREIVNGSPGQPSEVTIANSWLPFNLMLGPDVHGLAELNPDAFEAKDTLNFSQNGGDTPSFEYWTYGLGTAPGGTALPPEIAALVDNLVIAELTVSTICVYLFIPVLASLIPGLNDKMVGDIIQYILDTFGALFEVLESGGVTTYAVIYKIFQGIVNSEAFWKFMFVQIARAGAYSIGLYTTIALFFYNMALQIDNIVGEIGELNSVVKSDVHPVALSDFGPPAGIAYSIVDDHTIEVGPLAASTASLIYPFAPFPVDINNITVYFDHVLQIMTSDDVAGQGLGYAVVTVTALPAPGKSVLVEIFGDDINGQNHLVASGNLIMPPNLQLNVTLSYTELAKNYKSLSGQLKVGGSAQLFLYPVSSDGKTAQSFRWGWGPLIPTQTSGKISFVTPDGVAGSYTPDPTVNTTVNVVVADGVYSFSPTGFEVEIDLDWTYLSNTPLGGSPISDAVGWKFTASTPILVTGAAHGSQTFQVESLPTAYESWDHGPGTLTLSW